MSENVIDVIKIGLEYILLAIFLLFVGQVIQIRNSYASGLNTRSAQESASQETLEYSMYDTGDTAPEDDRSQAFLKECISGDEVVSCIRNYADGSINIYVDGAKGSFRNQISDGRFVLTEDKATDVSTREMFTEKFLRNHIYLDEEYHPYLIYDSNKTPFDEDTLVKDNDWYSDTAYKYSSAGGNMVKTKYYNQKGEAVTGIAFIKYKGA